MASTTQNESSTDIFKFAEKIEAVPKSISGLLASYSGIPKDTQLGHVVKIRDEAYACFPYPCVGSFRFLDFPLATHYAYEQHVLSPLKRPSLDGVVEPLFLDLGTGFSQDVRKLIYDGMPAHRLWASDIEPKFIDFGFELFRDAEKLSRDRFLCPGDLFSNSTEDKFNVLDNRVTILHLTAVFHLFSFDDQKTVADRCLRLLRKDTGAPVLILGAHVGNTSPGPFEKPQGSKEYRHKYDHDDRTWQELWQEVCGRDEWKDRIGNLDVKSRLLKQTQKKDVESGEITTVYTEAEADTNPTWQMFEVWVTFT
ncbi:uncharacterized protein F4822DRAFT_86392 [Hypoxylon trugodes]|uniref:uncharacterized protein n=1 Tax=Hypoxylon trugodes TaxID=326681 RepID=UPI0021991CF6|nr:uncharacterized protein F4822DRAFT_86392 [Hypoxylon trugodes]KAI1382919.1 hypothetical protein F4822DRAFT_86392 [Hypoxylon trugodes]